MTFRCQGQCRTCGFTQNHCVCACVCVFLSAHAFYSTPCFFKQEEFYRSCVTSLIREAPRLCVTGEKTGGGKDWETRRRHFVYVKSKEPFAHSHSPSPWDPHPSHPPIHRERETHTHRQTDKQTDTHTHTHTGTLRYRHTHLRDDNFAIPVDCAVVDHADDGHAQVAADAEGDTEPQATHDGDDVAAREPAARAVEQGFLLLLGSGWAAIFRQLDVISGLLSLLEHSAAAGESGELLSQLHLGTRPACS